MARFNAGKVGGTLAAGFGALWLAHRIEYQGDFAYVTRNPGVAAGFHLTALMVDLVGLGCFIGVFVMIVRGFRDKGGPPPSSDHEVVPLSRAAAAPVAQETDVPFDPDAIMARYMAQRSAAASQPSADATSTSLSRGFGRKQV